MGLCRPMGSPYIVPVRQTLDPIFPHDVIIFGSNSQPTPHSPRSNPHRLPSNTDDGIQNPHRLLSITGDRFTCSFDLSILRSPFPHSLQRFPTDDLTLLFLLFFHLMSPCFTLIFDPVLIFSDSSHYPSFGNTFPLWLFSYLSLSCLSRDTWSVRSTCPKHLPLYTGSVLPVLSQTLSTQCSPSLSQDSTDSWSRYFD